MSELFDVYDERGNWMYTAPRETVHAHGLWHHTIHCWLVRKVDKDKASILFQKRSMSKDINPGSFDITAAGHLEAGETPRDAVRELEEELGLKVSFDQLSEYGVLKEQTSGVVHGESYTDAEISHVFGLVTTQELQEFTLQAEEVSGLYEGDVDDLIALLEGGIKQLEVHGVSIQDGRLQADKQVITCSSFVSRDYGYYKSVFRYLYDLAMK